MECSKCHEVIKNGDKCYQVRYGSCVEHDAQDEFIAEEDVAYYHEKCFPIKED